LYQGMFAAKYETCRPHTSEHWECLSSLIPLPYSYLGQA